MNTRFVPQVNRSLILLILLTGSFSPVQAGALDRLDHPAAGTADTPHPILTTQVVREAIAYCTDRFALAQAAYPDLTDLEIEALMMDSFLPKDN